MAFYAPPVTRTIQHPYCGVLQSNEKIFLNVVCTKDNYIDFLCEIESEAHPTTSSLDKVSLAIFPLSNQTLLLPHVTCPLGHMTLDFLACDVQSACWSDVVSTDGDKWGVPSYASCPAPLTSLPPSFQCGSGDQMVSFSLVCNYRSDCLDSSDEKFCEHPPCAAKSEFMCLPSRQVRWLLCFLLQPYTDFIAVDGRCAISCDCGTSRACPL